MNCLFDFGVIIPAGVELNYIVESCPDKYTSFEFPINICIFCMSNCITCSSKTECALCAEGYTYLTDPPTCFKNCIEGYFRQDRTCERCSSECAYCENETKCRQNYYLLKTDTENRCTYTCPSFYYEDKAIIPPSCESCPKNCEDCSNSFSCNRCEDGYYLDSSTTCKICPSICKTCSTKNEIVVCSSCLDRYYKHQDQFVETCPKHFHEIDATKCVPLGVMLMAKHARAVLIYVMSV
jgi:proprotein convertase subtilisin/kexin type 5